MRNFQKLYDGINVTPLLNAINKQPELWNQQTFRTQSKNSTMYGLDDILLRFVGGVEGLSSDDPKLYDIFQNDINPDWNCNILKLPQVKDIVRELMHKLNAYSVGRCLISRMPPGSQIKEHNDTIGLYVNQPDLMRCHIMLQGLPGNITYCGGEEVCMKTGEVWWFNTRLNHKVKNNSADDRIMLLLDLKIFP